MISSYRVVRADVYVADHVTLQAALDDAARFLRAAPSPVDFISIQTRSGSGSWMPIKEWRSASGDFHGRWTLTLDQTG